VEGSFFTFDLDLTQRKSGQGESILVGKNDVRKSGFEVGIVQLSLQLPPVVSPEILSPNARQGTSRSFSLILAQRLSKKIEIPIFSHLDLQIKISNLLLRGAFPVLLVGVSHPGVQPSA
jgi:hypothetical protein